MVQIVNVSDPYVERLLLARSLPLVTERYTGVAYADACRSLRPDLTYSPPSEFTTNMQAHPLRLYPGDDLRTAIEDVLRESKLRAAFVIQGIGSLSIAQLRFAGAALPTELLGDLEILTVAGSVSPEGAHLHMSVADARGQVFGGHVLHGCKVRTTAELLLALLPEHAFSRETDPRTGFAELVILTAP